MADNSRKQLVSIQSKPYYKYPIELPMELIELFPMELIELPIKPIEYYLSVPTLETQINYNITKARFIEIIRQLNLEFSEDTNDHMKNLVFIYFFEKPCISLRFTFNVENTHITSLFSYEGQIVLYDKLKFLGQYHEVFTVLSLFIKVTSQSLFDR